MSEHEKEISGWDLSVLLVVFSQVPTKKREEFLKDHPELLQEASVSMGMTAANMRFHTLQFETAASFAFSSFEIAKKLGMHDSAAEAADLIGKACTEMGKTDTAFKWTYLAAQIRENQDYMGL